jgi:hypothetical protein
MDFDPSPQSVDALVHDFARDFGVILPNEDARRILSLPVQSKRILPSEKVGEFA